MKKDNPSKKTRGTKRSRNSYLIKRILITNALSLIIIVGTYFWMIFFLSNVGSFWDLFRRKEAFVNTDVIPPTAPYLSPIPEATQEAKIDLNGRAEPGTKVTLFIDGSKEVETITDSDGNFSFTNVPVGIFEQRIYVTATDEAGNESRKSTTYKIILDNEPPDIEMIKPEKSEDYKSTGHSYTVKGKTEPGATVYVNDQLAIISPDGNFSASIRLQRGQNEIKVLAKDKAGNETEKTVYVNFEKIE